MSNLTRQIGKDMKELSPTIIGIFFGLLSIGCALYLGKLLTSTSAIQLSDYIQLVVLIVIASTLAVSIYVQAKKEMLDESQAFLDSSIDLINKAYDVLVLNDSSVTTDRVAWVTAARLLTRASALSLKIKLKWHREIFESEHDFQRHRFGGLLKVDGKPLPMEFFFGIGHVVGSVGDSAYETLTSNGANWLPVRIVSTIYQFKSFPQDYVDPLDSSRVLNSGEMDRLWLFEERGIHDYLVFRSNFISVNKKVYRNDGVTKSKEVSPAEINSIMPSLSGCDLV